MSEKRTKHIEYLSTPDLDPSPQMTAEPSHISQTQNTLVAPHTSNPPVSALPPHPPIRSCHERTATHIAFTAPRLLQNFFCRLVRLISYDTQPPVANMPSTLRPNAPAWLPSASSYEFTPPNDVAPANFAPQPFATSFVPESNSFPRPFVPEPSQPLVYKFYAPESPPFDSQSFVPESPPYMSDPFSQSSTPPLYVHEQPLGFYSRAGIFVHTGVQYFYSHTPPHNNYPAHLPPTPPNMDWQWAVGGAGASQGWVPNAQHMTQWGGETEKTKKKKKKAKRGKGKGWKNKKSDVKTGEEQNGGNEMAGTACA
jgi:hypothetical protein